MRIEDVPGYAYIVRDDRSAAAALNSFAATLELGVTKTIATYEHPNPGCQPVEVGICKDKDDASFVVLWRWHGEGFNDDDNANAFGEADPHIMAICRPHQIEATLKTTPCAS